MARKTVYVPDELLEQLELLDKPPDNLSEEFQRFIRSRIDQATPASRRRPSRVRAMRRDDIDRVLELWDQVDDEWHLTPMAQRSIRRNLEATVDNASAFCLVAEDEGEVRGFVTVGFTSHPVMPGRAADVEELKVDRDHRGRGLGRELLQEAVRWIHNAGLSQIRAHISEDQRSAAKLFRELGFREDEIVLNLWPD